MNKKRIKNLNIGDSVLITNYNPPLKAKVGDMYELPYNQVPMVNEPLMEKYHGKNIPIVEVFIDGRVRSFVADVVEKV